MLDSIRIILVNTSHPGNIGAAARAIKTMGLSDLYLVNPKVFPAELAVAMSSGADDILAKATVVSSIEEALRGSTLIIGTSARSRSIPWPRLTPKESSEKIIAHLQSQIESQVALVFGEERSGLPNEILQLCHYHLTIPTNPHFSSLNLASSVQVIAYECYQAWLAQEHQVVEENHDSLPPAEEMQRLFTVMERVLIKMGFLNPKAPRQLLARLHRFFLRTQIETMEMAIFRGIFAKMEKLLDKSEG